MSRKKIKKFESFGDLLVFVLRKEGKSQSWMAEKTNKDGKQISNYISEKTTPFKSTIYQMANKLGIDIEVDSNGIYTLYESNGYASSIEDRIGMYKSEKENKGFSENERDLLLRFLVDHSESLSKESLLKWIRRLIDDK